MTRTLALLAGLSLAVLLGCVVWQTWLRKPALRNVEVHVTDARGAPIEHFALTLYNADAEKPSVLGLFRKRWVAYSSSTSDGPRPGGIGYLLLQDEHVTIEVRASGHGLGRLGPVAKDLLPPVVDIELPDVPFVEGVVQHRGAPVAGANVELLLPTEDVVDRVPSGLFESHWYLRAVSDASGRFRIGSDGEHTAYTVSACSEDFSTGQTGPVRLGDPPVVVELTEGGAIDGALKLPPGSSAKGFEIELYLEAARYGTDESTCTGSTLKVDDHGRFRFEHVAAGDWLLRPVSRGQAQNPAHPTIEPVPFVLRVEEGRRMALEIDAAQAVIRLEARLTLNGRPWQDAHAQLYVIGDRSLLIDTAYADKSGGWTLRARAPGTYRLVVHGDHEHEVEPRYVTAEIELDERGSMWERAFTWRPSDPREIVLGPGKLPVAR
jgi:hypothetical protein